MASDAYQKYICRVCGFIYDEALGDPDSGLAAGTRFEDIPDDWTCPLCGVSKADMILLEQTTQHSSTAGTVAHLHTHLKHRTDEKRATVIIGSGIAGWDVAAALRARDPHRILIMVTAGSADYYPKPALSMAYAQQRRLEDLIEITGPARAAELNVILREQARVIDINRKRKRLLTTRGSLFYDKLIIATGAQQTALTCQGNAEDDVLQINDLVSYQRLRKQLSRPGMRISIIGAGLIGCELAEDLTTGGHEVTLLERNSLPLSQLLPKTLAESLRQHLCARGIQFISNASLTAIKKDKDQFFTLEYSRHESIQADVIISALGLLPNTRLARKAGLEYQRGIIANPHTMQTSDKDIYVLGDCAQIHQQCYAYIEPIHRQAETIAAALSGDILPFVERQPLIRVKTPSLPLAICPPSSHLHQHGHWQILKADAMGYKMAYLVGDKMLGFAVTGNFTQCANELYEAIKLTGADSSEASTETHRISA